MDYYETHQSADLPTFNTAKDFYVNLLGLKEFPSLPENLPRSVFLPYQVVGDFEEAILKTIDDNRERRQFIFWNGKESRKSPLYLGMEKDTGEQGLNKTLARVFFGEKSLIEFHTHGKLGYPTPSPRDIASDLSFPRMAFIHLVGSQHNVFAVFQTEKSARLPFSIILKALRTHIGLDVKNFSRLTLSKQAAMLNKYGLGLFYHEVKPWDGFTEGCFQNGLLLKRAF